MVCRKASTGNCCEICQGITSLRYGCTLALSPAHRLRRCGTRKLAPIHHYRTIYMKENIENSSSSSDETRSVFIGAKVTPSQKEHIKSLAEQCGMTVSDYILLQTQSKTHEKRSCSVAESGRLSVRPRKIYICTSWNVHKATHDNVQSDSVHGRLA